MGRQKVALAKSFTDFELDIVLCDVDTVWLRDPTEYFERFPEADILTSSDGSRPTQPDIGDDGLEMPDGVHSALNIGARLGLGPNIIGPVGLPALLGHLPASFSKRTDESFCIFAYDLLRLLCPKKPENGHFVF